MTFACLTRAAVCAVIVSASAAPAIAQTLPFSSPGWDLTGPSIRAESGELVVETGIAYRRDVRLEDGTIDFEVQLGRRRSFVYVSFRMENDREFEEFYLRPHKSGLPDAVQYAPVRQGQSAWQLYHGAGGTASVTFQPDAWTPVRVILSGQKAAIFVGDLQAPALVVDRLARRAQAGYLALRGFIPGGTPGTGPSARFRNVRVTPGTSAFVFPAAPAPPAHPPGALVISRWDVSQPLPVASVNALQPPSAESTGTWRSVDAEAGGLVELHRWVPLAGEARAVAAAVRTTLRSERARVVSMELGFSDKATVFLNGQPLATIDAAYSFDRPRREGLIGFDQVTLHLPLRAGENTLTIVIADGFGGMGVMARLLDATGVQAGPSGR